MPGSWTLYVDGTPQSHVEVERPDWLGLRVRAAHRARHRPRASRRRADHGRAPRRRRAHAPPLRRRHAPGLAPAGGRARERPRRPRARAPAAPPRRPGAGAARRRARGAREAAGRPRRRGRHRGRRHLLGRSHPRARDERGVLRAPVVPRLAPGGIVAVNVADGAGLAFARSQASTLAHVFAHVAIAADTSMLKGRRFGNVVMYASHDELPFAGLPRRLASDPAPAKLVDGDELHRFIAGAPVVTDATAVPSPPPARSIFLCEARSLTALRTTRACVRAAVSSSGAPRSARSRSRRGRAR